MHDRAFDQLSERTQAEILTLVFSPSQHSSCMYLSGLGYLLLSPMKIDGQMEEILVMK